MKRPILAVSLAAFTAFAFAPRAHAQVANPVHVGVSGGVSFPTSDAASDDGAGSGAAKSKVGYNVNGILAFQVPLFPVGLRAEAGYNKFDGKDLSVQGATGHADLGVISGTLNAVIKPTGMLIAHPYFIGGVGAYRTKLDATASGFGQTINATNKKTSVGVNGGVGINFALGELSTFLEARYHYVFNKEDCGGNSTSVTCIAHKETSFVPISFGVMF